ncbi:MAG TPA: EamA family transporter [Thermodesulfobacteriota bacterium]
MLAGLLLVSIAAVSWGTTGATMTLLARGASADPLLVGVMRLAVAAPVLVVIARLKEGPLRVASPFAAVLAGLCMSAYQVCYFLAVTRSGVALTALVAICSAPLMIAVMAAVGLRERLTPRTAVSLVAGVAGTALLVLGPRAIGELSPRLLGGVALALGAGFSYALYAVVTKRGLVGAPPGRQGGPIGLAAVTFTIAAAALAPCVGLAEGALGEQLRRGWPLFLYLGVVPTAFAYALYTTGLSRVPATAAGIATLLEPLTATALGVAVFGESLGVRGAVGAALLLCALLLLTLPARGRAR